MAHRQIFFNCFCNFKHLADPKVCNFQMPRIIPQYISVTLLTKNQIVFESLNQYDGACTLCQHAMQVHYMCIMHNCVGN